jgi:hypothetical protein
LIDVGLIPHIEKALGMKLYDSQIKALTTDDFSGFNGRRCGKTMTIMINWILSEGEPIDLFRLYTDRSPKETNYTHWFRHEFMVIREKLKIYGFKVRDIKQDKLKY